MPCAAELQALQQKISPSLLPAQNDAGHYMKELGMRLLHSKFEATALDGKAKVEFNGHQQLSSVSIAAEALQAAGGNAALAQVLLTAMQEAFDRSKTGSQSDVWQLYRENPALMQAPLGQIGAGATATDLWANVTRTEETVRLAEDIFNRFDVDKDEHWNLAETSKVQMMTEGTEMSEESFNSLVIAAAPDGGRKLTEADLAKGLSREQVITLYTDAQRQRQLGFMLNVFKDHAKIFQTQADVGAPDIPPATPASPSVD